MAFDIPPGSADCHVHVFDPDRFPYSSSRRYTPPSATVNELRNHLSCIGMEHVVLVQPSVYGTDNSCLLDALLHLGPAARGVAVIGPETSASELAEMREQGVRAVRLNLEVGKQRDPAAAADQFLRTQDKVGPHGLFLQINAALSMIAALGSYVEQAEVPVLFDHFGLAQASLGVSQSGFSVLVDLLKAKSAFVKLSGPYQISTQAPSYADTRPIGTALVEAESEQIVWGSDWPHTGGAKRQSARNFWEEEPFRTEDDRQLLGLLQEWAPDADARKKILVTNAVKLFGFQERCRELSGCRLA